MKNEKLSIAGAKMWKVGGSWKFFWEKLEWLMGPSVF
jgi:hypothetical protein